jgi:Leucine-rich repeat (LRR) protein
VTDEGLKELKDFKNLTELHLAGRQVTDATLRVLRSEGLLHLWSNAQGKSGRPTDDAKITSLNLSSTKVTGEGLKHLKGLNLAGLSLDSKQVTDGMLQALREAGWLHLLPLATAQYARRATADDQIYSMNFTRTPITNAGLKELRGLKSLASLYLGNTAVTDEGLKEVKHLEGLSTLNLMLTKVTDTGLKELKGLKKLTRLDLNNTKVTDEGLKQLKDLESLVTLDLTITKVTDEGLKELKGLKKLTALYLRGTKVTPEGVKDLQSALPRCKVLR